jgi:septum formation topological specificity factor MinE
MKTEICLEFQEEKHPSSKFEHYLEFEDSEDMEEMFEDDNKSLSNLIVDIALKNLDTTTEEIPVISIYTKNNDTTYEVIIDRNDMIETLEANLEIMEDFEDYERCQKITDALYYLTKEN